MTTTVIMQTVTIINAVGGIVAALYMGYSMFTTHKDDPHTSLMRFEWAFFVALILIGLDQLRGAFNVPPEPFTPSMLGYTAVWVAGLLFSRHLQTQYK